MKQVQARKIRSLREMQLLNMYPKVAYIRWLPDELGERYARRMNEL